MVRILLDQVFRTPDQMANILGTDCLAVVPFLKSAPGTLMKEKATKRLKSKTTWRSLLLETKRLKSKATWRSLLLETKRLKSKATWRSLLLGAPPQNDQAGDARQNVRDKSVLWAVLHHPFSRYTEAVRSIKLAIDLNGIVKSTKVIGFTSSVPNEGKTSLALALAQLMAQVGAKVILVDCDIRNPSMSRTITPAAEAGLLEVIAGTVSLTDAVWNEGTMNLDFLPTVVQSGVAHSNEILASGPTKAFFNSLREKYDYVIADFSPLAPVVDVRATADLVDSYIFVVEWGKTKIDVVKHALGGAQIVRDRMLGAVLNKTDMEAFSRYERRHRNDYYFNKYYSKYGYTD
jgi:succinoglycan biosynthesis transport protein ExoP